MDPFEVLGIAIIVVWAAGNVLWLGADFAPVLAAAADEIGLAAFTLDAFVLFIGAMLAIVGRFRREGRKPKNPE